MHNSLLIWDDVLLDVLVLLSNIGFSYRPTMEFISSKGFLSYPQNARRFLPPLKSSGTCEGTLLYVDKV